MDDESDPIEEDPLESLINEAEVALNTITQEMKHVHQYFQKLNTLKTDYHNYLGHLKQSYSAKPLYKLDNIKQQSFFRLVELDDDDDYKPTQKCPRIASDAKS